MVWLSNLFVTLMRSVTPLFGRRRIREISVNELAHQLKDNSESIVLVDAREKVESDVSLIPGAITKYEFESNPNRFIHCQVIAYCTIGGRGLLFAQRFAKSGFNAVNLKGGIIAWCEARQPLVDSKGNETNRLHTHNRLFQAPTGYVTVC